MNTEHTRTLVLKSLLIGIPALVILSTIGGLTFVEALISTITLTLAAYLLGDMYILLQHGNTTATIADAILAAVTLMLFRAFGYPITTIGMVYTIVLLAALEGFIYHPYLLREIGIDTRV